MAKEFHGCIHVMDMLKWSQSETKANLRVISKEDGTRYSCVNEFRRALQDELADGHEVLPMGEPCEGFDYAEGGCPGHEQDA